MTSFGGGWTMCYTTDEYVDIKREVSSEDAYGINGFRANCNDIPVNGCILATKYRLLWLSSLLWI